MKVKETVLKLLRQEFDDQLLEVRFCGPFEDEDLDADVILREQPADLPARDVRIHQRLMKRGFDVLIDYQVAEGNSER